MKVAAAKRVAGAKTRERVLKAIMGHDAATIGDLLDKGYDFDFDLKVEDFNLRRQAHRGNANLPYLGSPLHLALLADRHAISLMIARSGLIHRRDSMGEYPIHRAAEYGDIEVLKVLLEQGAYVDQAPMNHNRRELERPLHRAIQYSHLDTVRFLVEQGANFHAGTAWAPNALWTEAQDPAVTRYLLAQGCDPYTCDRAGLNYAAHLAGKGAREPLKELFRCGIDMNRRGAFDGPSPLEVVCTGAGADRTLLAMGVEVTERARKWLSQLEHWTVPLYHAVELGDCELAQRALERGECPHQVLEGTDKTVLQHAQALAETRAAWATRTAADVLRLLQAHVARQATRDILQDILSSQAPRATGRGI